LQHYNIKPYRCAFLKYDKEFSTRFEAEDHIASHLMNKTSSLSVEEIKDTAKNIYNQSLSLFQSKNLPRILSIVQFIKACPAVTQRCTKKLNKEYVYALNHTSAFQKK